MAIKFLSGLNLSDVTAGSILKLDSNGNIVAATAGTDYASSNLWSTASNNNIYYSAGGVRIGTYQASVDAAAQLHVFDYQTTDPKLLIEDGNTGDASMQFKISTQQYTMGIDNSDSDKFILAASSALGTTNAIEVSTTGVTQFGNDIKLSNGWTLTTASTSYAKFGSWVNVEGTGLYTTSDIFMDLDDSSSRFVIRGLSNTEHFIANTATDTFIIPNWSLGIGTTSPSEKLHVVGNGVFHSGANLGRIKVGRSANQEIEIYVDDTNNIITAYQDSDGNSSHVFALDREFDGTGANYFEIRKGGSAQMHIDTSGNVGIGTTSPVRTLVVDKSNSGSAGGYLRLQNEIGGSGSNVGIDFATFSPQYYSASVTSTDPVAQIKATDTGAYSGRLDVLVRGTGTGGTLSTVASFNKDGNVGIGTTSPSSNLHVNGAGGSGVVTQIKVSQADDGAGHPGADAILQSSGWGEAFLKLAGHQISAAGGDMNITSSTDLSIQTGGTNHRMFITSSGSIGIGNTSPNHRLDVSGVIMGRSGISTYGYHRTVPVYSYNNGILIATNIATSDNNMIQLEVSGNTYSNGTPLKAQYQCYNYTTTGTFIRNYGISTHPELEVDVFHYNGYVYFWMEQVSSYNTLTFELYSGLYYDRRITQTSNSAKPTTGVTNSVTIVPKSWWHSGNDGSGSGLDADTVDGLQSTSFARSDADDTLSGSYTFSRTSTAPALKVSGHAGANSYNYILNGSNDGGTKAVHFVNGSTRTADGGANAYTIRNDGGNLVLGSNSYDTNIYGHGININAQTDELSLQIAGTERLRVDTDGSIKLSAYGAGILKTSATGIVSVDTSTYVTDVDWNDISSVQDSIDLNSTVQIGQGDTETIVSFQNSGTERGRFEVDDSANSYFVATGFKTSTASTGFLKADGTVDTGDFFSGAYADLTGTPTLGTMAAANTSDYKDSDTVESYVAQELGSYLPLAGGTMTGALDIELSTSSPLLNLYNTSNSSGAAIQFSDQTSQSQTGDITFRHTDGQSQGGGVSFHFTSNQPDVVLVVGDTTNKGRFIAWSANSTAEVDYGFADDRDTGMVQTSADNVSLVAGGVRGVGVGSTAVSLKYAGTTKLATSTSGISVTGVLDVSSRVKAGGQISVNNRTAISVGHWSASNSTTGAIKITIPGSHSSNWSMLVLRITAYEYNSTNHTIYYVSGHDWTSGWYNNGVTKMGDSNKDIKLGYDANKDYVILGGVTDTWSYGHVTVDVMAHPGFYNGSMDITSGWDVRQTTDLTGITTQAVTNRKVLTTADEGSGNGIDADTVDGLQASSFLRSDETDTASGAITFTSSGLALSGHYYQGFYSGTNNYIHLYPQSHTGAASVTYMRAWTGSSFRALKIQGNSNNITWGSHTLWTSGNDGSGSGLDADQLDGKHASDFVAVTGDDMSGRLTISRSATIGGSDLANSFVLLGTTSAGLGLDSNEIASTGDHLYIGTINAKDIFFRTNGSSKKMTIKSDGKVGIGTETPGGILHLEGNFESGKALVIKGTYGTDTEYYFRTHGTNSEYLALYAGGTRVMNFNSGIIDSYKGLRLFGGAISTGTSNHLVIGSSVQIGQGDEDPVIEFKYGSTSLGKIDQFGDIHAAGFKVFGTTGFLKSDGSVDTSTYASSTHNHNSDYVAIAGGYYDSDFTWDGTHDFQDVIKVSGASATTTNTTALFYGTNGVVEKRSLGTAAFSATGDFAAASHNHSGTYVEYTDVAFTLNGTDITVGDNVTLGSAAFVASSTFATAAQGTTADNALPKSGGTVTGMTVFEDGLRIGTGNHYTDGRASITFGEGVNTSDSMYIEYDGENLGGDNNAIIFGSAKSGVGDVFRVTYGGSVLIGSNAVATETFAAAEAQSVQDNLDSLSGSLGTLAYSSATIPGGSDLVKVYNNVNYIASGGTTGDYRDNYGVGVTVYEGYSGGTNRPHTYDSTVQFMSTSAQGFELSVDWVSNSTTPLKIRSLRDCCQGWSPWRDVAVAEDGLSGTFYFNDSIHVGDRITHAGDADTYIKFDTNRIRLVAGNVTKFDSDTIYTGTVQSVTGTGTVSGLSLSDDGDSVDPTLTLSGTISISSANITDVAANADATPSWVPATNPNYLTSYTETDTLASVTGRGASTTTALSIRGLTARTILPESDRAFNLGRDDLRWQIVFCETLDSAGQHESNLQDQEQPISQYATGTVLSWKGGKNRPCTQYADHMRMGIAVEGQDSPLIQGAEPVLVTGVVEEGDYLVTSEKEGHAVAVPRNIVKEQMLFDCVIGKALESGDGDSHLIKTWINI